jgi:homoserine/homoserine lactone efflux protein
MGAAISILEIPMTQSLLWFALTEFVLSLSPGPAVFLVLSRSLRHGFAAGMGATIGIIGVNVFYFILSLIGVGAALAASPNVFLVLKYSGAAYLAWTALQILRELAQGTSQLVPADGPPALPSNSGWRDAVPSGVLVQAASIKNLIIFLAIVPQFVNPGGDVSLQFAGLCAVSVLVELPILAGYAWLATCVANTMQGASARFYLDAAAALMLFGIAGAVLMAGQH